MTNDDVIIYERENGEPDISVRFENETVWLTIEQMSELFGKSRSTINEHILNIFKEKELVEESSMRKSEIPIFPQSQQTIII